MRKLLDFEKTEDAWLNEKKIQEKKNIFWRKNAKNRHNKVEAKMWRMSKQV